MDVMGVFFRELREELVGRGFVCSDISTSSAPGYFHMHVFRCMESVQAVPAYCVGVGVWREWGFNGFVEW